ncbi:hypothetical protein F8388_005234 [Cannabis sativa]|uniref:Pentatricopeptide repeat-containing protein n=1 Tax=Cannabis sativa TaxID=3483 RepID=A0A7J6ELC1_CANSA|nr:hypothetical protein F8388_005234 [Cannabis sativa]
MNEVTYGILLNRYAAAHMVDEAIGVFKRRKDFGFAFELDLLAFQTLLMWLCRGNVHEAKRFWSDLLASGCHPDLFTCGIFINALTKKGKLGTALKLFRAMWGYKRCNPDVTILGCEPNAATYNTLIKYL